MRLTGYLSRAFTGSTSVESSWSEHVHRGKPPVAWVGLLTVTSLLMTACGGTSDATDEAQDENAQSGDGADVPEGTVLRVASQQQNLNTAFELSGEIDDLPFEIEWANLDGGPAILEAIRGGSVDIAPVGVIPAIQAYAADDEVPAVLANRNDPNAMRIAISAESDIETIDDIEPGTRIAFAEGTIHAGNILRLLELAGLEPDEVELVRVPTTETVDVLQADEVELGSVDGQRLARFLDAYEDQGAGALPAEETFGIADQPGVLYASQDALDDEAREAAIEVFIEHYIRAQQWINENPEIWVEEYFVNIQQVTEEDGWEIVEANGQTVFPHLDDELLSEVQDLTDLLAGADELPEGIDAEDVFDFRYADVIDAAVEDAGASHSLEEVGQ